MTASDVFAAVGSPAVLTCSVSDNPNRTIVTYQWKRNGLTVATSAMYLVSSVGVSDAGLYTCEATVSDVANNPHVISRSGSVNMMLFTFTGQ